ncbi:MAG: quinone-dependent dihydroorotate dehydrogenase [Bdellovibrionales bacterium]
MEKALQKLLFKFSPEKSHELLKLITRYTENSSFFKNYCLNSYPDVDRLPVEVAGIQFPGPVGLAAGFDKNAEMLGFLQLVGFDFIEIGTVTPLPQEGNPKPRLFRDMNSKSILNRMGFNNDGMESVHQRISEFCSSKKMKVPLGINFGKNKSTPNETAEEDYRLLAKRFQGLGDYNVVNVSSPNTPGLRGLQDLESLEKISKSVKTENSIPLFLKLAPDLANEQLIEISEACKDIGYDGLILNNTSIDHSASEWVKNKGAGGLSGSQIRLRSREVLMMCATRCTVPIVSVGGIDSADEAEWRLDRGASLVQIYSSFVFGGPRFLTEVKAHLKNHQSKKSSISYPSYLN